MKLPVQNPKGAGVRLGARGTGILLAIFVIAVIESLNRFTDIKILNPGIIVAIPVIFSVLREGLVSGLAVSFLGVLYYLYFFSSPGQPFEYTHEELSRLVVVTASTFIITALTGSFKNAYEALVRRQSEQERREFAEESNLRFRTLVEQSTMGIQICSPAGETVQVNKAWERLWGISHETLKANKHNILHDQQLKAKGLLPYIRRAFQGEDITIPPMEYDPQESGLSGNRRWVRLRIYPLRTQRGGIRQVVVMYEDITLQRQSELALRQAKRQQDTVLNNITDAITLTTNDGRLLYANDEAAKVFGYPSREALLKAAYADILEKFDVTTEDGTPLNYETLPDIMLKHEQKGDEMVIRLRPRDGKPDRWLAFRTRRASGESDPLVFVNVLRDVTEERQREDRRKMRVMRQEFLAKAGEVLVSERNFKTALQKVAELAVPTFADWCVINLADETGKISEFVIAPQGHAFMDRIRQFHDNRQMGVSASSERSLLRQVFKTGRTIFVESIPEDGHFANSTYTPEQIELFRALALRSAILVPLKVHNLTMGVMALATAEGRGKFSDDDVAAAEGIARMASLMIQNNRHYAQLAVAARKEHEQAVLLDTLLDRAPVGFALLDTALKYLRINEYLAHINGLPTKDHIGKTVREVLPEMAEQFEQKLLEVIETGSPILNQELSAESPSAPGEIRHWVASYYPVQVAPNTLLGVGVVVTEVTAEKAAQKEIPYRAHHDILTGLPNRKSFEETVGRVLIRSKASNTKFAVIFADMDRLKTINDTLGHDFGDLVLQETAKRMKSVIRNEDFLCRWAGDEFVILLPDIYGPQDVVRVAERLKSAMEPPIRVHNHTLHASLSVGIALFPHDGEDLSTLQRNADTAMYRAKDAGKNRYELYDPAMNFKAADTLRLENDLRQALARNELELNFQPIYDLHTHAVTSVETLLRWRHPSKGLLKPAEFLALAEETGLIIPISKWAFRKAAELNKLWRTHGILLKTVVNVSPRQFSQESLVSDILSVLDQVGLDSGSVELEITENMAMENLERTRARLRELKDAGIDITIDDFGTGYSSLNYLKRFPVHQLKIDKSFVRHAVTDEQDLSIIRAIISLARNLGLKVVAEGVNSDMQLSLLQSLGCDAIQGSTNG